jgi:arsenate reductase
MSIQLYHNPRCSKSRQAKDLLESKGIEFETILYLQNNPSREDLENILKKLNLSASQLIRKKEKVFLENNPEKDLSEKTALELLVKFPILIERPIVVNKNKAAIGRPIENILEIL